MCFVKKQGDVYVLIDGAPTGEGAPEVAEGAADPVPDAHIPHVFTYPTNLWAHIEAAQ